MAASEAERLQPFAPDVDHHRLVLCWPWGGRGGWWQGGGGEEDRPPRLTCLELDRLARVSVGTSATLCPQSTWASDQCILAHCHTLAGKLPKEISSSPQKQ